MYTVNSLKVLRITQFSHNTYTQLVTGFSITTGARVQSMQMQQFTVKECLCFSVTITVMNCTPKHKYYFAIDNNIAILQGY